uniref:Uncharacterized protein n=1 Tax=Brassica oleracea TaxID=3712 RepID=A0A3P6G1D1_BRAOL|nr:unnamed protein product [Brassica oleracea]
MTLFGSRFSGTEGGEEKEYGFCVCCGAEVLGDGQIGVSGGDLG